MGKSTVILKRLGKVFNREEPQMSVILACLLILALISIILAVGLGPVSVAPAAVAKIVASRLPLLKDYIEPAWLPVEENIVWGLRLPRVLLGMIVGASFP